MRWLQPADQRNCARDCCLAGFECCLHRILPPNTFVTRRVRTSQSRGFEQRFRIAHPACRGGTCAVSHSNIHERFLSKIERVACMLLNVARVETPSRSNTRCRHRHQRHMTLAACPPYLSVSFLFRNARKMVDVTALVCTGFGYLGPHRTGLLRSGSRDK